jgi:hypothetical protein
MRLILAGLFWVALFWAVTQPLWGQGSRLPEAPSPVSAAVGVAPSDPQWERVERLPLGELVELRDRATGLKTECVLAFASNSSLGCDTGGPYDPPRRVVYPKSAIEAVWVTRWVHGPSGRAVLIGAGIGALVGGLVLAQDNSPGSAAAGIGLGALLGAGCSNLGDPFHTRMSKRSYRIYRSATP